MLFDETTSTMFCGDLMTRLGDDVPLSSGDPIEAAAEAEDLFHATCLTPTTGATIRNLAALNPTTLAIMHGSSFSGDGAAALDGLADAYDARLAAAM